MTDVMLYYGISTGGKGDGSDWIEWETTLEGEEEAAYLQAIAEHKDLNDGSLDWVLEEDRKAIMQQEIQNGLDYGDEYVQECVSKGISPFDESWMLFIQFAEPEDYDEEDDED